MQQRTCSSLSRVDSCSSGTSSNPNRLANRTQRITRKGSSRNVCFGGSGVLMIPFFRSSRPCPEIVREMGRSAGEERLPYQCDLRWTLYARCKIASLWLCPDARRLREAYRTSGTISKYVRLDSTTETYNLGGNATVLSIRFVP